MFLLNLVLFILRGCMVKMVKRWSLWPGEVEICPSVQPDDPGLPRRLTREFPFGFRGGLSVHSHGPRAVCFFAPQPNLVSSWTKQNPILKNQKVGLCRYGLLAYGTVSGLSRDSVSPRTHACILILENANDNPDKQLSHWIL